MSATEPICAACGKPPTGMAGTIHDGTITRYCHPHQNTPTCYERAHLPFGYRSHADGETIKLGDHQ